MICCQMLYLQGLRDLKSMKTLAGKTVVGSRSSKGKNKPPSVSAQFNVNTPYAIDDLIFNMTFIIFARQHTLQMSSKYDSAVQKRM